ncbi:26S proteasome non-ATPase regulatory subunit 5-like protein [Dinothrombium tinctorium]|uniref:26S proteasome non-ATPase regulatory subunit 5 n=1 Tax=Dinothrombium tinctorium TaxID=1965070 RepID=A0A3S3PXY4_9ACAR|nr:26S proteasome non-ATPase regulatory subunit 5-like protein [Dinothrombium tinctorium]RWS13378.1 26S proteasome non-ATPase regulatory subunit 5-like protein [Dinothrombium tinctorium]RWS13383.1 26S proteasome non-ATPase regulatory subunit 5-like protein [Dinothrombium tinctorium]
MSENIVEKLKSSISELQSDSCSNPNEIFIDLKSLLTVANRKEIVTILNEIDLKPVFERLNELPSAKEESVELFETVLTSLSSDYLLSRFQDEIVRGLQAKSEKICNLWLKVLSNCMKEEDAANNLVNADNQQSFNILLLVVKLMANASETTAKYCHTILSNAAQYNSLQMHLFSDNFKAAFSDVKNSSEVAKMRVYDLMVAISSFSPFCLNKVDEMGYLIDLIANVSEDDPLIALNCIQLVIDLSLTPHGRDYLHTSGALRKIVGKMTEENPLMHLILPGYLRIFGSIGKCNPSLVYNDYNVVIQKLLEFVISSDEALLSTAIETIGIIGETVEGKQMFANYVSEFNQICLQTFGRLISCSSTNVKSRVLTTIAQLLSVNESDPNGEMATITETWFKALLPHPAEKILSLAKQPFQEIRLPALNVIKVMATHLWGQKQLAAVTGFVDYLMDRSTEREKAGKEAKYDIVVEIVQSPFGTFAFNRESLSRMKRYYHEGPFFVSTETAVAIEEGR